DGLVVGGAPVVEEHHEHLAVRDRLAHVLGQRLERLLGHRSAGRGSLAGGGRRGDGVRVHAAAGGRGGRAGSGAVLGLGDRAAGGLVGTGGSVVSATDGLLDGGAGLGVGLGVRVLGGNRRRRGRRRR